MPQLLHLPCPRINRVKLLAGAIACLLAISPSLSEADEAAQSSGQQQPVFEEWVVTVLQGKTCGYGSTITTESDTPTGPQFLTVHQERFVVLREGTSLTITDTSKVTEDADGGVLNFDEILDAGSIIEAKGV